MKALYDTLNACVLPWPRTDDQPVQGLDASLLELDIIETPQPELQPGQTAMRAADVIDVQARTLTWAWTVTDAPPVTVAMRALRFALAAANLYDAVEAAAQATTQGKVWWQTSQTVRRDHPFVAQLAATLNQSAEDIDAIFASAQALEPTL